MRPRRSATRARWRRRATPLLRSKIPRSRACARGIGGFVLVARRTSREVATATTVLPRRARWRSRDDGVPWRCLPCAPCVDARRARNAQCVAMQRQPVGAPKKKKNVFRSTSRRNTPRKTDGRRRPMPQQIWKGPEIKINDAPPRRSTSAAGAHDAWETALTLYATTNLTGG